MKRKIKKDYFVKELAGVKVKIDEEATEGLKKGFLPNRGLFGKWAVEEFINSHTTNVIDLSSTEKVYFAIIEDENVKAGPYILLLEEELE